MSDWLSIPDIIEQWGYWGVALLMFIETAFPPIPSEVIMPLAGVAAGQGKSDLWLTVLAGTAGAMAGNIIWFAIAWKLGLARFERFLLRFGRILTLDEVEIHRGRQLFERYGGGIVGVGRVIPTVRSLVSIPAGLVRMNVRSFLIYSTIGTAVWTLGLTLAGYFLGQHFHEIDKFLGPLSTVVILVVLAVYLYRVIMWDRLKSRRNEA